MASALAMSFTSTAGELSNSCDFVDGERVIERECLAIHLPQQRRRKRPP